MRIAGADLRRADDAFPDEAADGVADRAVRQADGRGKAFEVHYDLRRLLAELRKGIQQHLPRAAEMGLLQGR